MKAPRFEGCRACKDRPCVSPVSDLLRDRVSPELRYLQAKFAAQLPYRQAADLLRELLPESGGLNHATTRNRTLAVGRSLDRELCREIEHPQVPAEPATEMVVGIDGAFVKANTSGIRQKQSLEILTRRVETTPRGGDAFAVVRNLEDGQAKQRVQAILRRCGFHISRRIDSIGKQLQAMLASFSKPAYHPAQLLEELAEASIDGTRKQHIESLAFAAARWTDKE